MESDEPKRRGRPPGSRNKPKEPEQRLAPPSSTVKADYRHVDLSAMVERQAALIDWAQQAVRNEMNRAMGNKGTFIDERDVKKLSELSNALVRCLEAIKKADDLEELIKNRLSGEQLLELALRKIEGQDIATLNYAIKRLRAHRERIAPVDGLAKMQMGERKDEPAEQTATSAIAELVDAD